MIKEFFAKLIGYEGLSDYNKRQKDLGVKTMRTEKELAEERKRLRQDSIRADGVLPSRETVGATAEKEKHDQAA